MGSGQAETFMPHRGTWKVPLRLPTTDTSPLGDFVHCNAALAAAPEAVGFGHAEACVLGGAATDPCAPHPPRRGFHFVAHQRDDSSFGQPELRFNRLKRRTVFPSHLHNAVNVGLAQYTIGFCHALKTNTGGAVFKTGDENEEKRRFAAKNLCRLWPPIHVAQKMGESMGRGKILQRPMPESKTLRRWRIVKTRATEGGNQSIRNSIF